MNDPVSDPAVFLIELAAFFDAAGQAVDDALAAHFGSGATAAQIIARLELLAASRPQPPLPLIPVRSATSTGESA